MLYCFFTLFSSRHGCTLALSSAHRQHDEFNVRRVDEEVDWNDLFDAKRTTVSAGTAKNAKIVAQ